MEPAVVITGAGGDLGAALCARFRADGWTVWAADLEPPRQAELRPVAVDVTDRAAVFALAERAAAESDLHAWVNGAGLFVSVPVTAAAEADWQRIIAVNLTGTWHGCAAALSVMAPRGRGRIVNVGSVSGQIGGTGSHPAYGASKAGVHALTKTYALEGAKNGIACNAVAPGLLDGGMVRGFAPQQVEALAKANPMRRLGRMDEVAETVRFLADPAAAYVNGAIVPVNGGAYLYG